MTVKLIKIERAFHAWLIQEPQANSGVADKTRRQARQRIRTMVGAAVFHSRRPSGSHRYGPQQGEGVELAVTLMRSGATRDYALDGELGDVESRVTVTTYGRGYRAAEHCTDLAEWIRVATTGFYGEWFYVDDRGQEQRVRIDAAHIASERELPPVASKEAGDRWHYRYATDWQIRHEQTVPLPSTEFIARGPRRPGSFA